MRDLRRKAAAAADVGARKRSEQPGSEARSTSQVFKVMRSTAKRKGHRNGRGVVRDRVISVGGGNTTVSRNGAATWSTHVFVWKVRQCGVIPFFPKPELPKALTCNLAECARQWDFSMSRAKRRPGSLTLAGMLGPWNAVQEPQTYDPRCLTRPSIDTPLHRIPAPQLVRELDSATPPHPTRTLPPAPSLQPPCCALPPSVGHKPAEAHGHVTPTSFAAPQRVLPPQALLPSQSRSLP